MEPLTSAAVIAATVLALADAHQEPLHIYGLSAERTSQAELVLQGKPFKADCTAFTLTAVDLMRRAGIKSWAVKVTLPPTAPCVRALVKGRITCNRAHAIAAYVDSGVTMALDIRQVRAVPLTDLMQNSRYTVNVDRGGR
ncbi:MAG: hypothetical protein RIA64_01555 [Rhodospirillales bacterium]